MKKKKTDKIFETVFSVLLGIILFIPIVIMVAIDHIGYKIFLSKQFEKLKNAGYKISKGKDQGKKVYFFTSDLVVIEFLPNEIHNISFDGGKTYVFITESNVGTLQEKESLKYKIYEYHTCDDRDRDMYDSTEELIRFILKNIPTNQ